ncbi:hypothetical protein BH11PLA1_BH11PLA1_23950 [soil metagenome]
MDPLPPNLPPDEPSGGDLSRAARAAKVGPQIPLHTAGPGGAIEADLDSASLGRNASPAERAAAAHAATPARVEADALTAGASPAAAARLASETRHSRWGVLRHKHFRTVIAAAFCSNVGNWMELVGVQILVATQTKDLRMSAGLGIAATIPTLTLGLFGGLVADRVNRRTLLIVTQLLMMLVAAGVLAVSLMHWPPGSAYTRGYYLIALTALNSAVMAFNMPAWQVMTPSLVPRSEIMQAMTLNGIQFNLGRVIGPLAAGVLMAAAPALMLRLGWIDAASLGSEDQASVGVRILFMFNTLSFLVVAAAVWTTPNVKPRSTDFSRPVAQIRAALSFIISGRAPRAVFLAIVTCSALAAPLIRLVTQFAVDVYGESADKAETTTTFMIALLGAGAVTGGLSLRFLPSWYPRHHFIPVSISGLGLLITLFACLQNKTAGYIVMFPIGLFWVWAFNQTWASMQSLVPDDLRGRVMAVAGVASFGATGLGFIIAGGVGGLLNERSLFGHVVTPGESTQAAIAVLAITLAIAGIFMLIHRTPEIDDMPRLAPGRAARRNLIHAVLAREHWPE